MNYDLPPIIGICGFPTHGKTTVQGFLELIGVEARDDGDILRKKVAEEFDLSWEDVSTQEGKAKKIIGLDGQPTTIRKLLGDYGKVLEAKHGINYIAKEAIRVLSEERKASKSIQAASFGSIRMNQPAAYKEAGGFIIEVLNPNGPLPVYDFDHFDRDYVDVQIINDGNLSDLAFTTLMAVKEYLPLDPDRISRLVSKI